jgi:hypothetical protein
MSKYNFHVKPNLIVNMGEDPFSIHILGPTGLRYSESEEVSILFDSEVQAGKEPTIVVYTDQFKIERGSAEDVKKRILEIIDGIVQGLSFKGIRVLVQ